MYLRSFLALRLNGIAKDENGGVCGEHHACPLGEECVVGNCVPPVAFYHLALDPGIEREETPGIFTVSSSNPPH